MKEGIAYIAEDRKTEGIFNDDGRREPLSSYLPEVFVISDRILVCRQGRVLEEFSPAEATEERIMYAAVH